MKHLLASLTVLLFVAPRLLAQQVQPCASTGGISPDLITRALQLDAERGGGDEVRTLKLKVVIAATDGGPGGQLLAVQPSKVQAEIDVTNEIFARCNTGIQIQLCGPIQVVQDPGLYWSGDTQSPAVQAAIGRGYITALYSYTLAGNIGGYATGELIAISSFATPTTLAHEIGHVLGLSHTMDNIIEPELVDGSNCAIGGDMLCDTPADPNLSLPDMVAPPCTYVGTITDANGDLYMPMLNNLMSYSPCTTDSLTPQQGALMRFMVDSIWLHLRRTSVPIAITPFDLRQCDNAGPLQLTASPSPGTFSGPLVNGSTLNNAPNPPGEYFVRYVPSSQEGPTAIVDQYLMPGTWRPEAHFGLTTDSVWQSFRADLDGEFHRMDFYTHSSVSQPIRLRVYAGTGPQGMPLLDVTATMDADTSWTSFFVAPGVASEAGNTYTALVTTSTSFAILLPLGATYANGESGLNGPDIEGPDVEFRHWIIATPDCQETTRYYTLYEVPARPILNLPDAYCHSDDRPVQLTVDPFMLTSSEILVDGDALNTFVPSALVTGEHLAQHSYTLNGCTDTLDQLFLVEPPPSFTFPNLASPLCTTDAPFVIDADPSGGYFRINGVRDSLLAPTALGLGTHTIDYVYSTLLDTMDFSDQICCSEGLPAYLQLLPDSLVWQSFNAQQSGELNNILMGLVLSSTDTRTFEVSIHAGTGLGGPLLWSDTRTIADGYNTLFANTGLTVEQGSTYTWAYNYLPDSVPLPLPEVLYYTNGGYENGEGEVPGMPGITDLYFNEVVRQRFPCADSTSFSVSVEVCSGIADNLFPGMYVAPVPFSDRLVLNTGTDAVRITMYAADGRALFSSSALPNAQLLLPVADLPPGCYMLRVWALTGDRMEVLKLVKE